MQQELVYDNDVEKKLEYELDLRGFSRQTKEAYIYHVRKFLDFSAKPPKLNTLTDARRYVLHLKEKGNKPASINLAISAIKFLYMQIWARKSFRDLRQLKKEKHVPLIIPRHDIERMIDSVKNTKHKLLIELLYSSGLRIGEAVKIKIADIRIQEKIAIIKLGKGSKDRYVILSERFTDRFFQYLKERALNDIQSRYLFENKALHISIRTGEAIIKNAARKAGIDYNVFPHALRASFATHLFEHGEQELNIQKLMGHANLATTRVYIHSSLRNLQKIKSPIDY